MPRAAPFRLLSFNIQAGLHTRDYRHYVTGAWRYLLPVRDRRETLSAMAALMRGQDFVAIQEADAGSLRTGQLNLIEYLAAEAGYPYHDLIVTRNLAPFARICIGYLSRFPVQRVVGHALPGRVPGRGALEVELSPPGLGETTVIITHLALGAGTRKRQFGYLARQLRGRQAVVIGDFNQPFGRLDRHAVLRAAGLRALPSPPATFPSWRPRLSLDQVLVMPGLEVVSARALPVCLSDHLPLAVELVRAA